MKLLSFRQSPFQLHGVPFFAQTGRLERLPQAVRQQLPSLEFLGRRCPGARLCFRTNSQKIYIKITFESITPDIGMSIYACQSANVFTGERSTSRYAGLIHPSGYDAPMAEGSIEKEDVMEDVLIFLPRNEVIEDIVIGLDDGAAVESPTPYRHETPILYYGSSITEGGCCGKPANAYNALISRWLDVDYYNFGFSGCARGEITMADYINTIPMSIFVMDYDHNAPTLEHLANTHQPFFDRIRQAHPQLPVVMLSRPNFDVADAPERREVVRATYENALRHGDKNVYFLDGETFFGMEDRHACTADTTHPNDLGMYRMAKAIAPVISRLLKI